MQRQSLTRPLLRLLPRGVKHSLRRIYISRQVIAGKAKTEPEIGLLKTLLRAGDVVADVGANVGIYTLELSRQVGSSGKVLAFEPLRENYAILQSIVRKAKLANVFLTQAALGSTAGYADLVIPDLGGFIGYYWAHFAKEGEEGLKERVTVLTLNQFFQERKLQRLDLIKCDVEGSELDVIKGGNKLIASSKPAWLVEVSRHTSGEVFAYLQALGYTGYVFNGRFVATEAYRDKEFSNYFFFHPDSVVWKRLACHL
jgi:FkbM family methyltransferase